MAVTSEIHIVDLNRNKCEISYPKSSIYLNTGQDCDVDDDVFVHESLRVERGDITHDVSDKESITTVRINLPTSKAVTGTDVTCQTDIPSPPDSAKIKPEQNIFASSARLVTKRHHSSKSSIGKNTFCWRHDAYGIQGAPARPSSPSSAISCDKIEHTTEVSRQIVLHQGSCSICKSAEERRLNLKSRKELTAHRKVSVEPSLATVKNCPSNLLQDTIPNCSDIWAENQTFYLGISRDRAIKTADGVRRRRIRSVPTPSELNRCFYCQESISSIDLKNHPTTYCKLHSFRIRSLSFTTKGQQEYCLPKWTKSSQSGRRDWLLVQRVTKKIPTDPQILDTNNVKPYYCEYGPQEMIFCLHDLRTVSYIEDVCCQHFLLMSRQEALDGGKTVELLFSPQGPVVREDKHLKGRSLFYFCCHVEKSKPRRSSSFTKPAPYKPGSSLGTKKEDDGYKSIFEVSFKGSAANNSFASNQLTKNASSSKPKRDIAPPVPFDLIDANTQMLSSAFASNAGIIDLASFTSTCSANTSNNNNFSSTEINKKKSAKRTRKDDMRRNSRKEHGTGKSKKTVTFSDEVKEEKENILHPNDDNAENQLQIQRRSSLPPPPKLKLTDEDDDGVFHRRKRRESVAISFGKEPTTRKSDKVRSHEETPVVASYQKKQWKTINVIVSFKNVKFSGEFFEYKSLQDLYTWLRQELLKEELLTPGADLLLTHENLTFPLKANTATKVLSSLPTTTFYCNEIIKASINDGGFGESTSKYDTRFALPLDTRELEGLNPVQYLGRYCIVSSTWKAFYLSVFSSYDKWKKKKLNYKQVCAAMERLFVELAYPLLKRVVKLMGLDVIGEQSTADNNNNNTADTDDWKTTFSIGPNEFVSMCSLANRIICREDEIDGFHVNTIKQKNTQLEDADFFNIEGKIRDYKMNPLTKRLLLYVRNKPR
uniref:uncharacterized protein LOC120342667 isoform X2 n=1 Tax=Styela clava TaxID=7725 RepID=UPI001939C124|nr:uncharacterized protein LOC120342667 isoform X2 [Styela clava]